VESVPADKASGSTRDPGSGNTGVTTPLVQSTAAATATVKPVQTIAFDLASTLHSLAGAATTAPWGAAGRGDASSARDDDLNTAWSCEMGGAAPCVLGISFPAPVGVRALRLFAAAGPRYVDYRAVARPKKIRVHTDGGWVEATLEDGAADKYLVLDKIVQTGTVAIEVLEVYPGKKGKGLWVAEIDAYGDRGEARPPLELDPARAVVSFETDPWKEGSKGHTARLAFLDEVQADGRLRRVLRGTAIHGRATDRFLLVEKLFSATCEGTKGSYSLLDRETRMLLPLGEMGGIPGKVALRSDGTGVLVTQTRDPLLASAAVLEGGSVSRLRPSKKKSETAEQFAARLAFTEPPHARGGHIPGAAPTGCKSGTSDPGLVGRIGTALALPDAPPAEASICTLDATHRAVVGMSSGCGARWYAAVVGPAGEIVAEQHTTTDDGRGAWFSFAPEVGVLFEGTRDAGRTSNILRLAPDGVQVLVQGGALAVRRPKACDPCKGDFGAIAEPILPDEVPTEPVADDRGSPDGEAPEQRTTDAAPADEPPPPEEPTPAPPEPTPDTKSDAKGEGGLPTVTDEPE